VSGETFDQALDNVLLEVQRTQFYERDFEMFVKNLLHRNSVFVTPASDERRIHKIE
jgi:hypothetical protein